MVVQKNAQELSKKKWMTKHWKKSLKKAHEKTYFKRPAYYYSVGILTAWLLVACGGDSGWDIPMPAPKPKPTPTKGVNKAPTLQLADTIKFDLKDKPTIADFKKKLLEMIADDNTPDDKLTLDMGTNIDFSKEGIVTVTVKATDDGKDSKGKMGEKKSSTAKTVIEISDTRKLEIPTNDLKLYKEPKRIEFDKNNNAQPRLAHKMGIPHMQGIIEYVIKDSGKKITVLEIAEQWGSHWFKRYMKKIIGDNTGITYKWQILPKQWHYNENTRKFLEDEIKDSDFAILELNRHDQRKTSWSDMGIWDIFESYPNSYVSSGAWSTIDNYEKLANQWLMKVCLPWFYHDEHKKYYIHDNNKYADPQAHPIKNDVDSPLLVGIDIGSTSGATAANAATWTLAVKFLSDIGIKVDRSYLDTLLSNKDGTYNDLFENAYHAYTNDQGERIWTDDVVGHVLILTKLIDHFKVFAFNPEIANLQAGQQLPLMKNHDKIKLETIIIASEKAIIYKDGMPYIDYDLGVKQGLDMENFKKNIDTELKILVGNKESKTFYWKNY